MKRIHSAHLSGPLAMSGCMSISGPQDIGGRGEAPHWAADILERFPDIDQVAISGERYSEIYSRIKD